MRPATDNPQNAVPAIATGRRAPHNSLVGAFTACAAVRAERETVASPSAADVAGDHRTEQHPSLAVEASHLHLLDRIEIGRAGVDLDPRQQHWQFEIVQAGDL